MEELELNWRRLISVWWLIAWRGTLGGMLIGAVAGFLAAVFLAALGYTSNPRLGFWVGVLAGIPWNFMVLWMAFKKRYRGFRIALVADQSA